ncbi:cytochrome P450 [Coniophora puteana RWD-64-598 SS2]|uniref:Cytochrome P450 n=1 Tax=Coniophora puteana (strain RWD-64-598) TaxID=741705 RepID=A0A5M3MZR9_CONPW|nr:cytochrome P450 [Coniophora puteana RWD-64-598 SS2]EIW84526.1 cytochrome P450 [Coniophora puteana RWD-64-598 SS2]
MSMLSILREPAYATGIAVASLTLALLLVRRSRHSGRERCTIPGPRPLPLLGNVWGLSVNAPWLSYKRWSQTYGKIFRTSLLGLDIVVVNDEEVARELLDRRSSKYSGRMWFPTTEPYGFGFVTTTIGYTDEWRAHRRVLHHHFRAEAARDYRPMQIRKAHQLLANILESPTDYKDHIQTFSTSIIMSALYGYQARPVRDPLVEKINRTLDILVQAGSPEKAALVGFLPFVKYIPPCLPGGSLNAASCRESCSAFTDEPFHHLEETIEPDSSVWTVGYQGVTDVMQSRSSNPGGLQLVQDVCGAAFAAGAETTSSTLLVFVLAMVLNPDVQKRAYADITRTCGNDRLPTFEDRLSLPYIEAIVRETLRWYPVAPLGIPHSTTDDDIYEDHFIPKGTTVMVNVWGICRDDTRFRRPSDFVPERFLRNDGTLNDDTMDFVFGFGRRICPGKHLAGASLWAAIASMLTIFRFEKAKDANGVEIDFVPEWSSGSTSYPKPFPCSILPSSTGMNMSRLVQL